MLIELENFIKKALREKLLWGAMNPKLRKYIEKIKDELIENNKGLKELSGFEKDRFVLEVLYDKRDKYRFPFSKRFIRKPMDIYNKNL